MCTKSTQRRITSWTVFVSCIQSFSLAHLLQTEDERLGTENLVRLSGFTQSLLDDVTVIIIVLKDEKKTVLFVELLMFNLSDSLLTISK